MAFDRERLPREVGSEFRAAQRMRRGILPRASDEVEPPRRAARMPEDGSLGPGTVESTSPAPEPVRRRLARKGSP